MIWEGERGREGGREIVVVKYKVRLSNVDGVELFFIYLFIYLFLWTVEVKVSSYYSQSTWEIIIIFLLIFYGRCCWINTALTKRVLE